MKNHYEVLGISRNASQDQIKQAYRKLSKQHHPDVSGGSKESEKIFLKVQEAYTVLKDNASRESYDASINSTNKSATHKNDPNNKTRQQNSVKNHEFNINNIEKNFEHFFGFNPKTKEVSSVNNQSVKKNPLDTTDLFNRIFSNKK
ncbi:J domain-containing protein [Solibacillus sp. FSL K6-1523]|uniref:J domain-containing protein n=1 Tax=Solibacillus sp. FSL K6-1523 TaxID=2921471 RepID=UPI0030FC255E